MTDFPLTWMASAFRKNGLQVRAVKGWRTRGRPFDFAPRGVIFHHTASNANGGNAPALGICVSGKSDVPGPLCNVLVGRDGTVILIAAGRANHAGLGGPLRGIPQDSANSFLAGVEVENNGLSPEQPQGPGEAWSRDLRDTCDLVFATLLVGLGRRSSWLFGHKEWTDRKIDPARIDLDNTRSRVAAQIRAIRRGG